MVDKEQVNFRKITIKHERQIMNKIKTMLIALIAITAFSTYSLAGQIGFGVTGSLASITAEGSEKEGTAAEQNNKATAGNTAMIGSLFAEYTFGGDHGLTFGVDHIPGGAQISSSKLSRTDIQTSVEGTATQVSTSLTRSAQAEIDNIYTYYAELPIHAGLYVKAGLTQMDVTTKALEGTRKYGNKTLDGAMWGVGYKHSNDSGWYYKVEGTTTDFDTYKSNEANQSTNSIQNSVSADLDVTKATFALGYAF
jgi:hypothetical protein